MGFRDIGSTVGAVSVTPSDTTVLRVCRGLWVGGAGDLALTFEDGTQATLVAVPAGTLMPVRVSAVRAATTATSIVALY